MSRQIDCDTAPCPLKDNENAKFCPECGSSAAAKILKATPRCLTCNSELSAAQKFCAECGTPAGQAADPLDKVRDRMAAIQEHPPEPVQLEPAGPPPFLCNGCKQGMQPGTTTCPHCNRPTTHKERMGYVLANHQGGGHATSGRTMSDAEFARVQANMRKKTPSDRVYDPDEADPDRFNDVTGLWTPDQALTDKIMGPEHGRTARTAPTGQHQVGSLSSGGGKALPKDYNRHVRVIPYRFKNSARSGRQMVGPGSRAGPNDTRPTDEAYSEDGIDWSKGSPNSRAAKRKTASRKSAETKGKKIKPAKKTCPACGGADLNNDDICLACGTRGR